MIIKKNFWNEAVSCLLAPSGLQPPSRTSAVRIADAARLLQGTMLKVEG